MILFCLFCDIYVNFVLVMEKTSLKDIQVSDKDGLRKTYFLAQVFTLCLIFDLFTTSVKLFTLTLFTADKLFNKLKNSINIFAHGSFDKKSY